MTRYHLALTLAVSILAVQLAHMGLTLARELPDLITQAERMKP